MQAAPFFDQIATTRGAAGPVKREQRVIDGHDNEKRKRPVRHDHRAAEQPAPVACLPPRDDAEQCARQGQRCLHGGAALIGWLPLGEQCVILEFKPCRLFAGADIKRGAGEERGGYQSELTGQHAFSSNRAALGCQPTSVAAPPAWSRLWEGSRPAHRRRAPLSSYWDAANRCPR